MSSLPNRFGTKFIDHHFDGKLENLRSEQQSTVTKLKSQLDQLLDRGIRANEREFNSTILVWEKLIAAYVATNVCVISFIQHPDLNKATSEAIDQFLSMSDFSDDQKTEITSSTDKNRAYSSVVRRTDLSKAHDAIYEARISLMKESIFIQKAIKDRILEEIDLYHGARVEKLIGLQENSRISEENANKVIANGLKNLNQIEGLLRDRLCRS